MSTNGLAAAREEPAAVVTSKDDEEVKVHVGRDILEEGLLVKGHGEIHPRGKQMGLVGLGCSNNAVSGHFCHRGVQSQKHHGWKVAHTPGHVLWETSIKR